MLEILAPAGDKNSAIAAINAGADAIYLGLSQFSARSAAENFDIVSFKEFSAYARAFGVKIYVAMNTLVKDDELDDFFRTLKSVWNAGADAIIIADVFLGKFIKKQCPEIKLHLSTQAGVCNLYGAELAKRYGFDRVILSRETSIADIKEIAKIIETEVFVQGALCTAFSGQCYMSSFAGGNSGNRGRCKQPCRKLYSIDRTGYEDMSYKLSLADLCVGTDIDKLIEAGVISFKIEGRMRRPEYVAAAVKYYKNILNDNHKIEDFSDLKRTYNRGNYTKGLTYGQDRNLISADVQGHIGEFVGVIKVENGKFICQSKQTFYKGDAFKVLRNGKEIGGADFVANIKGGFVVSSAARLHSGDKLFVTTDTTVNERLLGIQRKIPVHLSVNLNVGRTVEIDMNGQTYKGGNILQQAKNRPLSVKDIKNCFKKVDKYPFEVEFSKIETDGVFISVAELNALRREAYTKYFEYISQNANVQIDFVPKLPTISTAQNDKIAAICQDFNAKGADILIFKPHDFTKINIDTERFEGLKFLYLPPFTTGEELYAVECAVSKFDGIYCDGIWAIEFAEKIGKPLFAGCGMNISNCIDVDECSAKYITLSKELTYGEQKRLAAQNVFALAAGDIKLMDLIYCPFGRKCKYCDRRPEYTLTDEGARKFSLRRYRTSECRFEVYNCAKLVGVSPAGTLLDCTLESNADSIIKIAKDEQKQKNYFKNYTRGHGNSSVI